MQRVFITGMGAVTPIGNDVNTFWENLLKGKSGAAKIASFDPGDMPHNIACEVKDFDATEYLDKKTVRRTAPCAHFAVAATKQALAQANFTIDETNREQVGVLVATGGGGLTEIENTAYAIKDKSWKTVGPFVVPAAMSNAVSCQVSIETGACGPVMTSTAACASGHYSIIEAYHFLQRGEADVIIAGGSESALSLLTMSAFGKMGPLSSRTDTPETACRPFSVDRDGFVSGEGACIVIMETEEHARKRGATIQAEVLGGRLTGDAYHITAPEPNGAGAARALAGAITGAGLEPTDIDLIMAHGTGTVLNDVGETKALKRAFGEHIQNTRVTSIKSMVGHALGAAGAQSAIAAIMALQKGIVPPTINYTPDPEIDIPIVGNHAEKFDSKYAIVNAFGFGGQNVVAVFGRVDE